MREDLSRTRGVARRKNCEDVMAATRGQETVIHTSMWAVWTVSRFGIYPEERTKRTWEWRLVQGVQRESNWMDGVTIN